MNNILKSFKNSNVKIILIIFSILTIIPTFSQAVSVPVNYTGSWSYARQLGMVNCNTGGLRTSTVFGMHLDKQFILQAEGVKNLDQNESTLISPGVNLVAYNYPVTGSYWYSSADYATPPIDGQIYNWDYDVGVACRDMVKMRNQMRGGIYNQLGYTLTSNNNNIIDCSSGNRCTTKSDGTAVITVSFPGSGAYYLERTYQYYAKRVRWMQGSRSGSWMPSGPLQWINGPEVAQGAWNYSLSPITYTVTVGKPNQAPTVNYNNTSNISYNTATANWSYTDPEGDPQTDAAIQIATDSGYSNIIWGGYAGTASNIAITGLTPGTTYYPRVAVKNAINDWTGWKNGPAFTTPDYPEPQVSFDLKSGTNIAQTGGTLTIKTAESVNASWSITNTEGVKPNSCSVITNNISGGVAADIFDSNVKRGLAFANLPGQNIPVSPIDQTYTVALVCEGKDARTPRNIVNTITLIVESYPTVSCRVDGSTTVKAGDTSIDINVQVGNTPNYSWEAGPNSGDTTRKKQSGNSPISNPLRLDYTGLDFGRYTPWVSVTKLGTNRTTPVTCGAITNFGSSNIKEVN